MDHPTVTIITPVLNAAETVERTIKSVLNQDYDRVQYLIVDGESTDGTLRILRDYQKRDERIQVVSRKDDSMTQALNRGLEMANGEIVGSLNADDWYEPNTLSHVKKIYSSHKFDFLIGNTRYVNESREELYICRPWLSLWRPAWYLMGCLTPESSVFYSDECIRKIGKFNESLKYTQDFEYYLRVMDNFEVRHVDHTLSNFLVSKNQISSRLHDTMEEEVLSYIEYKLLRRYVGGTSIGSLLQLVSRQRLYSISQLTDHIIEFFKKKIHK